MTYTVVQPEVAGGWGPRTVVDRSVHPPLVSRLHYEFDGWLGDEILESFPCFIVSAALAADLRRHHLTGHSLGSVEISTSSQFEELHPNTTLPPFEWLRVNGHAGKDDFGLDTVSRLIVSPQALSLLVQHELRHAILSPYPTDAG
jgi:hypothetical protein